MRTRGARTYLLAGLVLAVTAPLLPRAGQQAVLLAVGAVAGLAVIAGLRRHRPVRRLPWRLLLAALLVAETHLTLSIVTPAGQPFPRPVDWVNLLTYPLLIGALTATPGALRRAARSTGAVDAAIIACTAGVLSWALLVNDFLETQRLSPAGLTLALAYPLLDLFVACAVVRMAMLGGRRNPARLLLMLGAAAMVAADSNFLHGFGPGGPGPTSPLTVAGWLLACACLGAAALHPGMAHEDAPAGAHRAAGRGRLLRYGLLVTVGRWPPRWTWCAARAPGGPRSTCWSRWCSPRPPACCWWRAPASWPRSPSAGRRTCTSARRSCSRPWIPRRRCRTS
jgi:hypothetical protein